MVNAYLTYNTLCFDIVPVISQELIYPLWGEMLRPVYCLNH
jgi:hypothetical protein